MLQRARHAKLIGFILFAGLALVGAKFASRVHAGVTTWEKVIAPGVIYREEADLAAHLTIHEVRVSLKSPSLQIKTALAGGTTYEGITGNSRLPVSKIVSDEGGLVGVNGDFFSMETGPSGDPLGLAVRDGRILSTPSGRAAFGWGPEEAHLDFPQLVASFQTHAGSVRIDAVNRRCGPDAIVLDTPDVGFPLTDTPCLFAVLHFAHPVWSPSTVIRGRVDSIDTVPIDRKLSPDEAVLVGRGLRGNLLGVLRPGTTVTVTLRTSGFDWEKIDSVIGGGPCLVRGGEVDVDGQQEGFGPDFFDAKHPRTAIGRTADNDIWLVAVDGRQETGDGMTLQELARVMIRLGCVDAMNLDGGGSTTMDVLGVVVNRPSDGRERPVADGVVVMGPTRFQSSESLRITGATVLEPGETAQLSIVDGAGRLIPPIESIWGCDGAAFIDQNGTLTGLKNGSAEVIAVCRGHRLTYRIQVGG